MTSCEGGVQIHSQLSVSHTFISSLECETICFPSDKTMIHLILFVCPVKVLHDEFFGLIMRILPQANPATIRLSGRTSIHSTHSTCINAYSLFFTNSHSIRQRQEVGSQQ